APDQPEREQHEDDAEIPELAIAGLPLKRAGHGKSPSRAGQRSWCECLGGKRCNHERHEKHERRQQNDERKQSGPFLLFARSSLVFRVFRVFRGSNLFRVTSVPRSRASGSRNSPTQTRVTDSRPALTARRRPAVAVTRRRSPP